MAHWDVTVHFQIEAETEDQARYLVATQLDQDDLLLDRVQITAVEALEEAI